MDSQGIIESEYIPIILALTLYWVSAFVFAGLLNRTFFTFLELALPSLVTGGFWSNPWIGGVIEPFSTKLLPTILIGVLSEEDSLVLVGATIIGVAGFSKLIEYFIFPVSGTIEIGVGVIVILSVTTYHLNTKNEGLSFSEGLTSHPWIFGSLAGLSLGIGELYWYMTEMSAPLYERIPPLLLHSMNGAIIVGTFIFVCTHHRESMRKKVILAISILVAMIIHIWWNTWLISQGRLWDHWKVAYHNFLGLF